jgi:hypothetical protein
MATSRTLDSSDTVGTQFSSYQNDIALRLPTLKDFIALAKRIGLKIDEATQGIINRYEKLGFIEKSILGFIPFAGDTIDLAIQGYKAAKGQQVDPVVIVLSAIGLGADAATVGSVGLAGGLNASIAVLKATYQTMEPVAKASIKLIFEAASKSPKAMKTLREALPELADMARSGKLAELLADPKYVVFVVSKIARGSSSIGESAFRDRSKSDEKPKHISFSSQSNEDISLPQQQYDAVVAGLKEEGVLPSMKNIKDVLAQTDLSKEEIKDVMSIAQQVNSTSSQMVLG